jgi:hypothetical protein
MCSRIVRLRASLCAAGQHASHSHLRHCSPSEASYQKNFHLWHYT